MRKGKLGRLWLIGLVLAVGAGLGWFFLYEKQEEAVVASKPVDKGGNEYTELSASVGVPASKTWVISFESDLNADTVHANSVYVLNEKGEKEDVTLSVTNNQLTIAPPKKAFEEGGLYTLYIENEVNLQKPVENKPSVKMDFTVERKSSNSVTVNKQMVTLEKESVKGVGDGSVRLALTKETTALRKGQIIAVPTEDRMNPMVAMKIASIEKTAEDVRLTTTEPEFTEIVEEMDISDVFSLGEGTFIPYDENVVTVVQNPSLPESGLTASTAKTASTNPLHDILFNPNHEPVKIQSKKDGAGKDFSISLGKVPVDPYTTLSGKMTFKDPYVALDMEYDQRQFKRLNAEIGLTTEEEFTFHMDRVDPLKVTHTVESIKPKEKVKLEKMKQQAIVQLEEKTKTAKTAFGKKVATKILLGVVKAPIGPGIPNLSFEVYVKLKIDSKGQYKATLEMTQTSGFSLIKKGETLHPARTFASDETMRTGGTTAVLTAVALGESFELEALAAVGMGINGEMGYEVSGNVIELTDTELPDISCGQIKGDVYLGSNFSVTLAEIFEMYRKPLAKLILSTHTMLDSCGDKHGLLIEPTPLTFTKGEEKEISVSYYYPDLASLEVKQVRMPLDGLLADMTQKNNVTINGNNVLVTEDFTGESGTLTLQYLSVDEKGKEVNLERTVDFTVEESKGATPAAGEEAGSSEEFASTLLDLYWGMSLEEVQELFPDATKEEIGGKTYVTQDVHQYLDTSCVEGDALYFQFDNQELTSIDHHFSLAAACNVENNGEATGAGFKEAYLAVIADYDPANFGDENSFAATTNTHEWSNPNSAFDFAFYADLDQNPSVPYGILSITKQAEGLPVVAVSSPEMEGERMTQEDLLEMEKNIVLEQAGDTSRYIGTWVFTAETERPYEIALHVSSIEGDIAQVTMTETNGDETYTVSGKAQLVVASGAPNAYDREEAYFVFNFQDDRSGSGEILFGNYAGLEGYEDNAMYVQGTADDGPFSRFMYTFYQTE